MFFMMFLGLALIGSIDAQAAPSQHICDVDVDIHSPQSLNSVFSGYDQLIGSAPLMSVNMNDETLSSILNTLSSAPTPLFTYHVNVDTSVEIDVYFDSVPWPDILVVVLHASGLEATLQPDGSIFIEDDGSGTHQSLSSVLTQQTEVRPVDILFSCIQQDWDSQSFGTLLGITQNSGGLTYTYSDFTGLSNEQFTDVER